MQDVGGALDRGTRALVVALVLVFVASIATAGVLFERERGGSEYSMFGARSVPPATAATPVARAEPPSLRRPSVARPLQLWVGGDSLAAGPSWAVFEAARATGVVQPLAEYQVGTGLVRDEYWDWHRHLEAVVRARDPEVVVFMVGANDDQPLAVDGTSYQAPAPEWVAEYRRRVAGIMDVLARGGRLVVWIGMPPMEDASYSEAMGLIGGIMAEEASTRPAVTYVDAFSLFSAPGALGEYAFSIPDEAGEPTVVRLDDGVHLNVAGSQYLARRVMEQVGRLVELPGVSP